MEGGHNNNNNSDIDNGSSSNNNVHFNIDDSDSDSDEENNNDTNKIEANYSKENEEFCKVNVPKSKKVKEEDFKLKMAVVSKTNGNKGKMIRAPHVIDNPKQRPPLHDLRNASPLFEKDETSDSLPTTPIEFVALPSNFTDIKFVNNMEEQIMRSLKNYSDSEIESELNSRKMDRKSSDVSVKKGMKKANSYSVPGTPSLLRSINSHSNDGSNYNIQNCGGMRQLNSSKSLKMDAIINQSKSCWERPGSDNDSVFSKPSDRMSIKSLTSIGMGSTDGKKIIIRKVPTSPVELLNLVNSSLPLDEYVYEKNSEDGTSIDGESLYLRPNKRQHWSNKLQFVLACIGYTVGLGSIWRFPYLCYQSGGGVFLIPYFITMVICGIPMLYMELAIGQFTGRGPIGALDQLCPLFKGAGLASVIISFLLSTYYSVIIAYGIYYFFSSFKTVQPWVNCNPQWNSVNCWEPSKGLRHLAHNETKTPAEDFYDRKVLKISEGIEHPGGFRWELVACLLCAWVLIYFAIWKSIKSSAKVRYLTTTLPYLLIIVFLGKSLTLEGANKGTEYFFKPQWRQLADAKVWVNAVTQTFNSMGIAFGSMISFASYNKFNNNIIQDTLAVSFVNFMTSLLVGIYSFATIGNIALEQNKTIDDVIADGPGLIFVVYPQAMGKMPASVIWASLFFFMLICLGLNSMFAIVEVVVTSIQDGFPDWIKKNLLCHEMLVLVICVVSFFCGLPNVTRGGIYFFQLMDHYAASISLIYLAFFEVIAVGWFYGAKRLSENIRTMTGQTPNIYFRFCWLVAAPILILAIWISCLVGYESPTYNNGKYTYPVWARALGWTISSLSMVAIPLFAIYVFVKTPGKSLIEKFKNSIQPIVFECPKCGNFVCDHMDGDDDNGEEEEFHPFLIEPQNNKNEIKIISPKKSRSDNNIGLMSSERKISTYDNVNGGNSVYQTTLDSKNNRNIKHDNDTGSCSYHFTDNK